MRTLKFAVLGHPIRHSLSPTLFSKFKSIFSLKEFSYEILNVEPQNLNFDLLSEYDGLNVTSPYKSQVLEFAKVKSQEVEILSAANVLKKTRDEKFEAFNTDVYGFQESLKALLPFDPQDKVLILGAGGAARAVCLALHQLGYKNLFFKARNQKAFDGFTISIQNDEQTQVTPDIVVNATTIGMNGENTGYQDFFNIDFSKAKLAYDLIYSPKETVFMKLSQEKGVSKVVTGEDMLILQAYKTLNIWFGDYEMSTDEILKRVKEEA